MRANKKVCLKKRKFLSLLFTRNKAITISWISSLLLSIFETSILFVQMQKLSLLAKSCSITFSLLPRLTKTLIRVSHLAR